MENKKMQNILENLEKVQAEETARKAEEAKQRDNPRHVKRRKIIMVDDVQFQLVSVRERLKKYYEVYPAESSDALFELLANIKPEIILLDANLPEVDGFEIIKMLKKDVHFSKIPVIFLSGNDDKKNVIKGMSLGAVDFLKKPFETTDLYNCIEYHLDPSKRKEIKPIILAVDDNPSMLRTINAILSEDNSVYTLNSPTQLIPLLGMITPDLFLLDCSMPVLNGYDLVPMIRKIPEHAETPIIFLTSDGTFDNISAAIGFGAIDFMIKPVDVLVLREKIEKHTKDFILYRRIRKVKE
jgi:two-component system cell cycle response regulator